MSETARHLVICDCSDPEHQLILRRWEDDESLLALSIHLVDNQGIIKRAWAGLRYIFGYKSKFGEFDEVIINRHEAYKLANFLTQGAPRSYTAGGAAVFVVHDQGGDE